VNSDDDDEEDDDDEHGVVDRELLDVSSSLTSPPLLLCVLKSLSNTSAPLNI
jgi:hypothetical protein